MKEKDTRIDTESICYDQEKLDYVISSIATRIKECREERGLSRPELAAMAGVDASNLYRIEERGTNNFSFITVLKICAALDINVSELVCVDDGSDDSHRIGDCFERALRGCTQAEVGFCYDIIARYCHMQKISRQSNNNV